MSVKSVCLSALVVALLGASGVRAQYTGTAPPGPATPEANGTAAPAGTAPGAGDLLGQEGGPPAVGLSTWILGTKPCCCGPLGGDGPVGLELYLRTGPAFVVGGGVFDDTLHTGWLIQGGGRSLFFNPEGDAAWTVDLSLSNFYNHGKRPDIRIPLRGILVPSAQQIQGQTQTVRVPLVNVTVSDLDRTFANLGFGREWYLLGNAYSNTNTWRVGFDTGGRWGSASLETHELRHRTDVMGAVWVAAHTDVEIPCGCCIFQYGLRLEWDYTWSDILQLQNKADIQDLNLLVNLGVRF